MPFHSRLRVKGKMVVSPKDYTWPNRCVVCNAPADGFRLKRNMVWHHPAFYFLVFFNFFIYLFIFAVSKSGTIHVGLCEKHRIRRRNGMLIGWLGTLGFFCFLVFGAGAGDWAPFLVGLGILGILGSLIAGMIMTQIVRAKRIDDLTLWVVTGEVFRNSIR